MYRENELIKARNISKSFPGVQALSDFSFDLYPGEIHCLVGENGAGKSTFIKILSGALKPDKGKIFIENKEFSGLTPKVSQKLGVEVIYQENILVSEMSVAENIFVGREKTGKFGFIDYDKAIKETQEIIDNLGIELDPEIKVKELGVADQQFVKIIKALATKAKVIIMDEPTAMFNTREKSSVLKLVKNLSNQGIGIIYISHHLDEVEKIADRVTVLRDGIRVNCHDCRQENIEANQITKEMVGRSIDHFYKKVNSEIGEPILEIKNLKLGKGSNEISFELRKGEILGFAGMIGAGRTEIMKAIFGANKSATGKIIYKGKNIEISNPADAIETGIGFITEDRQKLGLALKLDLIKNVTLPTLKELESRKVFIDLKYEKSKVHSFIDRLDIKTPSLEQEVRFLSGGNQQKIVLARWLFADSEILIFDEPTRGIDVNAKAEIYKIMSNLVKNGKSIIMVSSEMPELITMSDRVIIVRDGEITGEISGDAITEENIISNALGVNDYEKCE